MRKINLVNTHNTTNYGMQHGTTLYSDRLADRRQLELDRRWAMIVAVGVAGGLLIVLAFLFALWGLYDAAVGPSACAAYLDWC